MPEPRFLRSEAAWPVEGSERTVLTAARLADGEIVPMKTAEKPSTPAALDTMLTEAARNAEATLARIEPLYVRDDNQVIQYAVLRSDDPFTASAVLAPNFAERFARTLGPELLLAIPNRNLVYVFPKQSEMYRMFADEIFAEYQSSSHPVSRELFELRKGKLIAIGAYR